jgi:DNA topoisomerase-1
MKLIIVESPSKCKKIEELLGKNEYTCVATQGHLRDIVPSLRWFDPQKKHHIQFSTLALKKKIIASIQSLSRKAEEIIIATDMDREGEAIGFHLLEILRLDEMTTKRILFNEITKNALVKAMEEATVPRRLLYESQLARRMIDFLFGFMISPLLWKRFKNGIATGRCQTPCLGFLVHQQKEFMKTPYTIQTKYEIILQFNDSPWSASTTMVKEGDLSQFIHQKQWILSKIDEKQISVSSPSPFITSTLQQTCYQRFRWSPKKTMTLAQSLYENGHITYMRTDSYHISNEFRNKACAYLATTYGESHLRSSLQSFVKKTTSQEAHECIRPTHLRKPVISGDSFKLYTIIYDRTIASLLKDGIDHSVQYTFTSSTCSIEWKCTKNHPLYLGFRIVDARAVATVSGNTPSPPLESILEAIEYRRVESVHVPHRPYSVSDLIKRLDHENIGRPSTYSVLVQKLQDHGYIQPWDNKTENSVSLTIEALDTHSWNQTSTTQKHQIDLSSCLQVTELGLRVYEWLEEQCTSYCDPQYTLTMEHVLDNIANGSQDYWDIICQFHHQLKGHLRSLQPHQLSRDTTTNFDKVLGVLQDQPVFQKKGRYGKYVQWKDYTMSYPKPRRGVSSSSTFQFICDRLLEKAKTDL